MKAWLRRLFSASPAPEPRADAASTVTPTQDDEDAFDDSLPDTDNVDLANAVGLPQEHGAQPHCVDAEFLRWLTGVPSLPGMPIGQRESRALQRLDRLVDDRGTHPQLLPRAAGVVPQLLARLNDAKSSATQLAQFVKRDVTLVAEVIRTANGAYYRRSNAVVEVEPAIRLIGVAGVQSAIARHLLRPMFLGHDGALGARCAKRLWEHTEHKAQFGAALARNESLDAFEGCLAGLVHNAVWVVLLRTLDGVESDHAWNLSPAFVAALGLRRDWLFEAVAADWQLSAHLTQTATDVADAGLAQAVSAPGRLLCASDRLATLLCLPEPSVDAKAWLAGQDEPLRKCYESMRKGADPA
jgi:HD-like signal output (HDOD) protein